MEMRTLIKKDVKRTHQELDFFRSLEIQTFMEEMLYIWAKQHPLYKYQQGLNELLAMIMVCLASELVVNTKNS